MNEIWKDIDTFKGRYQVSNLGRIRNNKHYIMKQKPRKDGYVCISLFDGNIYHACYVHILVAKAFIPNPQNKSEVNHIDADKSNNVSSNLEWVTKLENHNHAVAMNIKPICPTLGKFGAAHPTSKEVYQYSKNGSFIKKWNCRGDAAIYYNCTANSISRCILGIRKTCKGYIWKLTPPT